MAVLWCKSLVHGEEGDWGDSQQDPERVNEVDLNPEGHDNGNDAHVVQGENHAPEAKLAHVCLAGVDLANVVQEQGNGGHGESKRYKCTFFWLLFREIVGDLVQELVVFSDAEVGAFV